jgi:hypothetical protein
VRVELITAEVLPGMLFLRMAKLMGFPRLYVGITVSYRGILYVRSRHAGIKDYLNIRNGTAFCEFITIRVLLLPCWANAPDILQPCGLLYYP